MFRSYFKTAFRNLLRNKNYSIINIAGLAVGIAVCIMIFVVIQFHSGFDSFHARKDRIYRVLTEYHHDDAAGVYYGKGLPFPLPTALKTSFPQFQNIAPVYSSHDDELQVLDDNGRPIKNFKEKSGVFYTEPSFFDMFDFPLLAGSYTSLKDPNNVLLTRETAESYFGDWRSAMGKSIKLRGYYNIGQGLFQFPPILLKVTGILATVPPNSDFQFRLVVAYGTDFTSDIVKSTDWKEQGADLGCFVMLPEHTDASNINLQLRTFAQKIALPGSKDSHIIQPLQDIHFDTQTGNYSNKAISRELINVLWLIAGFILLIGCVNFVNLSTAQAVNRAKEVGVRKVLGSNKSQLLIQFLVETFLIVLAAMLVAVGITFLALPYLTSLLELSIPFDALKTSSILLFLGAVTVTVTLLAGFYPSIVLSRFNPINALKSKLAVKSTSGISLRRGLVVFQFVIAQALIIGTLIIVQQMNFFMSQPLGFDKEAIVNIPFRPDSTGGKLADYVRDQMLAINGVQSVTFSSHTPVESNNDMTNTFRYDHSAKETPFYTILKFADHEYINTYKLKLLAGRNLKRSDYVQEFLVNESVVKNLGLKSAEEIVNKDVNMWDDRLKGPIVGVLKDFSDRSFHHSLSPLFVTTNITMYRQVGIKLATNHIASTMEQVKAVWTKTFPNAVYEYRFLDYKIASFYKQEKQLAQLYQLFAGIAIFLSCLGLYGLASFMAVQRIKEVGIRKVLGASAVNIVFLFLKEFIVLITIALLIASPIAWYLMNQWLQDYAYRIEISWWVFMAGGAASLVIAFATVSFQAIKAALANPVTSLRSE